MRHRLYMLAPLVVSALALQSLSDSLAADNLVHIESRVKFLNQVKNYWDPDEADDIENAITEVFIQHLRFLYPHWSFKKNDLRPQKVKITLLIKKGSADSIWMTMKAIRAGQTPKEFHRRAWFKPGQIYAEGRPLPTKAKIRLKEFLEKDYFTPDCTFELGVWLRNSVPIARSAEWLNRNPPEHLKLVLGLPFQKFSALQNSVFKVSSGAKTAGHIEAIGMSEFAPFPPEKNPPDFNGIKAYTQNYFIGERRNKIYLLLQDEVRNHKLGSVYLFKEITETDFESNDLIDR